MKKHNGMRPQDIVILMKIIALEHDNWRNLDLAHSLHISASEVSEALNRCKIAGLIDHRKRNIHPNALKEFLIYGLKYVFPAEPGGIVKGIPTAHSANPIKKNFMSDSIYVWSHEKGNAMGQAIEPLYSTVPGVVYEDEKFYELMVIIDTIRIGRAREISIAIEELNHRIKNV
ncbi:hypothetical protein ACFLTA_03250 [Bacteroidota bacterium]